MILESRGSATPSLHGMHLVLALAQQLAGGIEPPPRVVMLTCGALAFGGAPSDAAHGGAWGFARVLRLEHAALRTQSADVGRESGSDVGASWMLLAPTSEAEAAWTSGSHAVVARLRTCTTVSKAHASLAVGAYAITGGLGGLGLRAAKVLVDGGVFRALLASRSGRVVRDGQGLETQLHSICLLYTSPSPRDGLLSRMPSSA